MKKFLTLGFVLLIAAFTVATQSQCQQSNHSGEPITTAEFDKIIAGDKLVMVDFYTTWCGPCKKMAPFIEQVREKHSDIVTVTKSGCRSPNGYRRSLSLGRLSYRNFL